jgi:hypothetical protein
MDLVNQGLEFRRLYGLEEAWADLEAKFFSASPSSDTGPNVIAAKGDTLISALAVPTVRVQVEPQTESAAENAPVVKSFMNSTLRAIEVDAAVEDGLVYSYLQGVGFLKIGYDSEYGFEPRLQLGPLGGSLSQFDSKTGRMLESGIARSGELWIAPVDARDVVMPWGTRKTELAPWIAHRVVRHIDDVKADEKYDKGTTAKLVGQLSMRDVVQGYLQPKERVEEKVAPVAAPGDSHQPKADYIQLWEIQDKATRKIVVVAVGLTPVIIRESENTLQIDNQLPWADITLTSRTRAVWSTPLSFYAAPHQNELDDIHIQAKLQRRASILKLLVREGVLSDESLAALEDRRPGLFLMVKDMSVPLDDVVKYIGGDSHINTLLHQEEDVINVNAREAIGIDRNMSGEYVDKTHISAEETGNVARGGSVRMGRKQKALRRTYKRVVQLLAGIVATHWTTEQAVKVVGPEGAVKWEAFRAEYLKAGRYVYDIQFSTEHYASQEERQAEAMALLQNLWQVPGIDKAALLQQVISTFGKPGVKGQKGGGSSGLPVQVPGVQPGANGGAANGGAGAPSTL